MQEALVDLNQVDFHTAQVAFHIVVVPNLPVVVLNRVVFLPLTLPISKKIAAIVLEEILSQAAFLIHLILLQNLVIKILTKVILAPVKIIAVEVIDLFFLYLYPSLSPGVTAPVIMDMAEVTVF